MATDLVGNERLQRFIQLLSDLNHETSEVFSSGRTEIFHKMNDIDSRNVFDSALRNGGGLYGY